MILFPEIMANYCKEAEALIKNDISLIKSNAKKGIFAGTRWQGYMRYDKRDYKGSRQKALLAKQKFQSLVKESLQLKQMQLAVLKTVHGCKSSEELNKMFESTMAQMCPLCKGGMITGAPHCKKGKDVFLFMTCALLFAAIRFEMIVRKREEEEEVSVPA